MASITNRLQALERRLLPQAGARYVVVGQSPDGAPHYLDPTTGQITDTPPTGDLTMVYIDEDLRAI